MKKVFSLCLVIAMIFGFIAGCTTRDQDDDNIVEDIGEGAEDLGEEAGDALTGDADEVTGASYVDDETNINSIMGEDGEWIVIFTEDMTTEEELVLEGEFTNNDEPARKIALYEQDDDRNISDSFTLTAPKLTIRSENTRIQGGTFKGDVYVEANGFSIVDCQIDGNVYFTSQEYQDSFTASDGGEITGETKVQE